MIALVAAVPDETRLLRRSMFPCEVLRCGRRDLYRGTMFGQKLAVLHCGVGKVNTAAAVGAFLEHHCPSTLIMIGCCGAYPGRELDLGDLVLASEEVCADEGVQTPEGFRDFTQLGFPLLRENKPTLCHRITTDAHLLESARPHLEQAAREAGCRLATGPLVTVSTCSGTLEAGHRLGERTGGLGENMEGAAAAQICALYGVPFLEIRGISNRVEDRDLRNWDFEGAAEKVQLAVRVLLRGWFAPRMLA